MPASRQTNLRRPLPRLPTALLRAFLPRAERDEVLADLGAEFEQRAAAGGRDAASRWLWRQALRSAPALLGWSSWRGWTGFAPPANDFRPGGYMLRSWLADARYAARRLRSRPVYTLVAVLTLGLGVGGTAAVFGIARPVMFDPLPYAHASEVGMFWMPGWWTEEEFLYLRDKFTGFREVAAYRPGDVILKQGDAPSRLLRGIVTSWELFDVLGAHPLLGRTFQRGDDAQGGEPVAVISYGLWQELGGSPSVVGSRLTLDGTPETVVGVMPPGFWFPDPGVRIWRTTPLDPRGENGSYAFVGRVAPGLDVRHLEPQVRRLTTTIGRRFQYDIGADKTKDARVTPLRDALLGAMRPGLTAMLAAMGLILLLACANVAALMLGQVEGRATELAVRSALGASRGRIMQQLVVEALLVGVGAAVVGMVLAGAGFRVLAGALPIGAWAEGASFDWSLFAVALALAVGAVLLVVVVPAVSLWRGDLRGAITTMRTGGVRGRGGRLEQGLVIAEVALAMLIASAAALLVRSVRNLYAIDPGVRTQGIAVVDVLSSRDMPMRLRGQKVDELLRALGALPGVRSAAVAMKLPLRGGGDSFGIDIPGNADASRTFTYFRIVSPAWFSTMGIRLREGRTFDASDHPFAERDSGAMAVVVNEAFAKKYFPGQSAVGRTIGGGFGAAQRIVGVVSNVAEAALTDAPQPVRYYLGGQAPWFGNQETFVLAMDRPGSEGPLLDAARRTVQRVAPDFAVIGTTTMQHVLDEAVGPARQIMTLLTLLTALALILGAVGIYGVISHFAARRQRDWAIRVALGLPGWRVVRHVVGQGTALVAAGIVIGMLGAALLARVLASMLYDVGTVDAAAFGLASIALLAIGVAAAFIPARRAGTVDPAIVMREQ